jgi:hypothetical protein
MNKWSRVGGVAAICMALMIFGLASPAAAQDSKPAKKEVPACCAKAQKADAWCDGCEKGFVKGNATSCKGCYGLMKAKDGGWCDGCKVGYAKGAKTTKKCCLTAIQKDAWCDGCKVGFADGKKTSCAGCHGLMKSKDGGWCGSCKVGHAKGAKTKKKCCLAAIQKDDWCKGCKVGFANGKKTSCAGCHGLMKSKGTGWCGACQVGHDKGEKIACKSCFDVKGKCASCAAPPAKKSKK